MSVSLIAASLNDDGAGAGMNKLRFCRTMMERNIGMNKLPFLLLVLAPKRLIVVCEFVCVLI